MASYQFKMPPNEYDNVSLSKKRVKFNPLVKIRRIEADPKCSFHLLFRMTKNIDYANHQIMNFFNLHSAHRIFQAGEEMPIKITSDIYPWYLDVSPINLLEKIRNNPDSVSFILREYHLNVIQQVPSLKSGSVKYYDTLINCYIEIPLVARDYQEADKILSTYLSSFH